jgi:hypothetical protein
MSRFTLLPSIALVCAFVSGPATAMFGASGVVLDPLSRQPVAGATVTLECRKDRFLHGSDKLKDVVTTTDAAGRYAFTTGQVITCDHAYVRPSKEGYVDSGTIHTGYGYSAYQRIPEYRYLSPEADAVMLRLLAITPARTGFMFKSDGSPAWASEYRTWSVSFFEAQRIAQTPREQQYVRERYCENMQKVYAALSAEDRAWVARQGAASYRWRGSQASGTPDHEGELVAYCAAAPEREVRRRTRQGRDGD